MSFDFKKTLLACLLTIGIFIAIFSGFLAFKTVYQPFLGILPFKNHFVGAFTQHGWGGDELGLGYHDRITAVDGVPLKPTTDLSAILEARHPGHVFSLDILTASTYEKQNVLLKKSFLKPGEVFKIYIPLAITGVTFLIIAMLALFIQPSPPGLAPFVSYCCSTAIYLLSAYDFHTTYLLTSILFVSIALMPATIVHMGLEFPEPILGQLTRRKLFVGAYALSGVILVPYHRLFLTDPETWVHFEYAVFFYISSAFLFWVGTLAYRMRKAQGETVRKQSRLILTGLIPSFGGVFFLMWLNFVFNVPISLNFVAPLCIFFPLTILTAMFRSNLFLVQQLEHQVQERTEALRKKELELFQTHKLASIGLLASGTAHEIGNAMNVIASNLPVLKKYEERIRKALKASPDVDPDTRHAVEDLRHLLDDFERGSLRVLSIMANLRNFAKPESTKPSEVYIDDVVNTTLELLKPKIPPDVKIAKEGALKRPILGVSGQIHQVVLNLLLNALDALGERGIITIEQSQTTHEAILKIQDNGPGIAPHLLSHLFDPFFTTKPAGTGLGLSISYGIVRDHGGRLEVQTEPGKGATFVVTLPLMDPSD